MPEKTHMYEIVPVDPISKLHKKTSSLEADIKEIKSALRSTVGLSKMESNADDFIKRMLNLLDSSQKMVESVAKSNQVVAAKIQTAIDRMNKANEELSVKLSKILNFFAQATEAMGGEGEGGMEDLSDSIADSLNGLKGTLDNLAEQNDRSNQVLQSIERHLKSQTLRRRPMPPRQAPPGFPPAPPGAATAPPPGATQQGFPDLPPPPFPP